MKLSRTHLRLSTYAGLLAWGASGFMAQPTLISGFYHILVLPGFLWLTIFLAHHEGRKELD